MNTCERARGLMQEHLEGLLLPLDRASMEAHLERCADCRTELGAWRSLADALDAVPPAEVPDGFADRVMADLPEMLPAQEGAGHVLRWGALVAALLSGCFAALALLVNESGHAVRDAVRPLGATLELGLTLTWHGYWLVEGMTIETAEALARADMSTKMALVVAFAAVNAALLAVLARLSPAALPSRSRRG